MPFTYHPPTRDYCHVCEELSIDQYNPIITTQNGKASSASNFPFHNWYYFVLGYSPEFPNYVLDREHITNEQLVVDPFMGTGTTLVACKLRGIPSGGVDANDFFSDVARAKLNWELDVSELKQLRDTILQQIFTQYENINFRSTFKSEVPQGQLSFLSEDIIADYSLYASKYRPKMLDQRYISDKPFSRWHIIKSIIDEKIQPSEVKQFFDLALASILVPISNVRYGPGFGVVKPRIEIDVYQIFKDKVDQMILDIETASGTMKSAPARVIKGDSREIDNYFEPNSVDLMITSPPYPGDHEYTKHTRLELIAMGYAQDQLEFRKIKQRMLRGSTTNIYKEDNERRFIEHLESIQKVTALIDQRLKHDGATSGFEKLYTKLVWEYFGGMYLALQGVHKILKPSGKIDLLVSDSHAFKMVHIQSAKILGEIGEQIGYSGVKIELWQDKISTSHKYNIKENILTLIK